MKFTDLKTNEDVVKFVSYLRKLKLTELPPFKKKYEKIKRIGSHIKEDHGDALSIITYKKEPTAKEIESSIKNNRIEDHWQEDIFMEKQKKDEDGDTYVDIYYIDPEEPGVIYVEHRYLIDKDIPVEERKHSILQQCFPPNPLEWAYLWEKED